ncbi:class I SAM-dependent methyltransferase [Chromatocurvus halotolerans]|uniref:Methyltransferase family protein n=1 Tax=Chromatocurvus halotolerans TaxID=1132028 RepID=A0A4R2KTG6_9GAMM|nr:class I SAM-dependent methyltransferase [Chromatocurvus halotolerans]TCO76067.1 methyltransferase family protein [Chromatocurvus halotolerans]
MEMPRNTLRLIALTALLATMPVEPAVATEAVAPYVVTTREDVQRMLDLASVGPGDLLIDLGSGDGRIPIAAAEQGALSVGIDIDPDLVSMARDNASGAGLGDRVHFRVDDVFTTPIAEASVVTLYLMPDVNLQLRPRLLSELEPGTRIVSNTFTMGEWAPDAHVSGRSSGGLLLWIVPDRIEGHWQLESSGDVLHIKQRFQEIEVTLRSDGKVMASGLGKLRGRQFTWTGKDVEGRDLRGTARRQGEVLSGVIWREVDSDAAPERVMFSARRRDS